MAKLSPELPKGQFPAHPKHVREDPVVEPAALLQWRSSGRRAHGQSRLSPSLQTPRHPRSLMEAGRCEPISPGNNGARPNRVGWCRRGEDRSSTTTTAAPKRGRRSRPRQALPASRTILSPHAYVPPPPAEQGRPRRGGDERPARYASAGPAKNNCGVLATAFPLAGRARRRLRIRALPQPMSRRGCARRALAGRRAEAAGRWSHRGGRSLPRPRWSPLAVERSRIRVGLGVTVCPGEGQPR